jgi:hypothetical protein
MTEPISYRRRRFSSYLREMHATAYTSARIVAAGAGLKIVAVLLNVLEVLRMSALVKFFNIEGAGDVGPAR